MILIVFVILAALPAIDSLVRLVLLILSKRAAARPAESRPYMVVVPARDEGEHVRKTLESVRGRSLLLLDGDDPVARKYAAEFVIKEPAGPTKAAALGWLATMHPEKLDETVLLLDVGSTLSGDFQLERAGVVQARLSGTGAGVGVAVAASETHAQLDEDRGREALGWSVRIRGTGTAFTREAFIDVMPRLRTRVEDLEATLLIIARGERVALSDAVVFDDKPTTVRSAASQRARWLLGRYELLFKQAGAFARALMRSPLETIAFFFEIFGRPLSLTIPFRAIVAIVAIVQGLWIAWAILATAVLDAIVFLASGRSSIGDAMRLVIAWLLAVILAPRALFRWMRAKRS